METDHFNDLARESSLLPYPLKIIHYFQSPCKLLYKALNQTPLQSCLCNDDTKKGLGVPLMLLAAATSLGKDKKRGLRRSCYIKQLCLPLHFLL